MIDKKQRRYLRSLAQSLTASFQVGKNGLSNSSLEQLDQQLENHELVKVSILQNSDVTTRDLENALIDFNEQIQWVNSIGRTVIFYKKASKIKNRKLSLEVEKLKK